MKGVHQMGPRYSSVTHDNLTWGPLERDVRLDPDGNAWRWSETDEKWRDLGNADSMEDAENKARDDCYREK
jgi:hypothetical protein